MCLKVAKAKHKWQPHFVLRFVSYIMKNNQVFQAGIMLRNLNQGIHFAMDLNIIWRFLKFPFLQLSW